MPQIRLTIPRGSKEGDVQRASDNSLIEDDGLETVATIALFTDARADDDDDVPADDRRGYWADVYDEDDPTAKLGSRIWVHERKTLTVESMKETEDAAAAALAFMVTEGIASRVVPVVQRISDDRAELSVDFYRGGSTSPYTLTWELHFALR